MYPSGHAQGDAGSYADGLPKISTAGYGGQNPLRMHKIHTTSLGALSGVGDKAILNHGGIGQREVEIPYPTL